MFPNPQDALPLPQRPDIGRYRKLAKSLVRCCQSSAEKDDWAQAWARGWVGDLVRLSGIEITAHLPVRVEFWVDGVAAFAGRQMRASEGRRCALADAQFVIARLQGFESWSKFVRHLESLAIARSGEARFEAAAEAIVAGDSAELKRLLAVEPGLVHARSGREHGGTLLHYVAANGVEGYRQRTPGNVVEITVLLLDAGADVNETAQVYGAGCTTLDLVATSGHPERAGVQEALLTLLLDRGATINPSTIKTCLANGRVRAAEFLAGRVEAAGRTIDFVSAAGLGRLDWVGRFFAADGSSRPGVGDGELRDGLLFACQFGRDAMVAFLLDHGATVKAADAQGQTGLHHAVLGGHPGTVRLLLTHQPPLDAVNAYGGTALAQALWSAAHGGDPAAYLEILEALVAAGAKVPERHVPVNPTIDLWLEQHDSRAEPEWRWFGE